MQVKKTETDMTDITNKQNETQGHKAPAPALGTRTYTNIHVLPLLITITVSAPASDKVFCR